MNATTTNSSFLDSSFSSSVEHEDLFVDQIGKTVARSLDKELAYLSPKAVKRLEAARHLAIAKQKKEGANAFSRFHITQWLAKLGPLGQIVVVLAVVLFIAQWQMSSRIDHLADVDSALLSDTIPPSGYADDGFKFYMKKMISDQAKDSQGSPVENSESVSGGEKSGVTSPSTNSINDPSNNQ
jgi:hypothetical protein